MKQNGRDDFALALVELIYRATYEFDVTADEVVSQLVFAQHLMLAEMRDSMDFESIKERMQHKH